jgi:hypothetical protein
MPDRRPRGWGRRFFFFVFAPRAAILGTHELAWEIGPMNARVRLVSSETVAEDANIHDAHENTVGRDEAPIGLPEEGGSNRNDVLGETPPPLVAEREDRAAGARDADAETKKGIAKLIALAWRRQAKAPAPFAGEGNEGEPKEGAPDSAGEAWKRDGDPGNPASLGDNPVMDDSQGREGAAIEVAAKSQRPILKRKGALAAALAASVAIPAIVVLNWPHSAPQPVVEPGMLADGQVKVMAPSAALATAPPREALNVSRDRPLVNETRRDELNEMLSFKAGDKAADGSTQKADAPAAVPAIQPPVVAAARETAQAPPAHPASETSPSPPSAPEATPPAPIDQAKWDDAAERPASLPVTALSLAPTQSAVARDHALSTAALRPEPGLGGAAKIEARLADLETAVRDRSNEARARLDAEKAETHTLEKIAELGALVTRLTGQVKDLQDKVQTLSTGADEKFADLTRRVALGEANRAVASAESGGLAAQAQEKGPAAGSEAQERTRVKVAAADVKHNYRIQAASPGLAMLTAVDGSPDDRPVEVAIGTELPGYGRVLSIEQHGQAWVVKADHGSIE